MVEISVTKLNEEDYELDRLQFDLHGVYRFGAFLAEMQGDDYVAITEHDYDGNCIGTGVFRFDKNINRVEVDCE